jgi:hypothetical protein
LVAVYIEILNMNILAYTKTLSLRIVLTVSTVGLLFAHTAQAGRPFSLPANAKQIAKNVYDLGTGMHNGEQVRGFAFIYRQDRPAKPDGVGGGKKDKGGTGGGSTCYAFIGSGAKWKSAENYIVDSTNLSGMSRNDVEAAIATATGLWNSEVSGGTIFGNQTAGAVDGADTVTPLDDKNEVYFADINDPSINSNNTIAVTITWGIFSGPPRNRRLVEWDQVYNEAFTFGDAKINTSIMDFLGIAAHEVGHAAGMDHPESTCTDETMYAYASNGEVKKRDLNDGDKAGIKALY